MSALSALLDSPLDGRFKGYPQDRPALPLGELGAQGWNLFRGDLALPCLVLRREATDHNRQWMSEFLRRSGASLCPHGKTTMAPQLFQRQLEDGAWGLTVATPQQARIALDFGFSRILVANEVLQASAVRMLRAALAEHPGTEVFVLADSLEAVQALAATDGQSLSILVELGYAGGRTGARSVDSALTVARAVAATPGLALRGVECYEGLIQSEDASRDTARVEALLEQLVELAQACAQEGIFAPGEVLITAGGSAYFDLVARVLATSGLGSARVLLRSGCYLTHDSGLYRRLVERLEARLPDHFKDLGSLRPALELWGQVLSRPELGLALLDFGKRDAPHDAGLPVPERWLRPGDAAPRPLPPGATIGALNDQHAYLRLPEASELRVGDFVGCAISHPCTAFDKWPLLFEIAENGDVLGAIRTLF